MNFSYWINYHKLITPRDRVIAIVVAKKLLISYWFSLLHLD